MFPRNRLLYHNTIKGNIMLRYLGPLGIVLSIAASLAQAEKISIETVTVGNPGNRSDTSGAKLTSTVQTVGAVSMTRTNGYGSVAYSYSIGKYEVTNLQYAAFLNAVAAKKDEYGLYNTLMADDVLGGIRQIFQPETRTYKYEVKTGYERIPVVFVNWYDAVRFCNWLSNGQLTGDQGDKTTENGVYKLTGRYSVQSLPDHSSLSAGQWFLPNEDEWYKAAYYDGSQDRYWDYATQSDKTPANSSPGGDTGNSANYYGGPNLLGTPSTDTGFAKTGSTKWDEDENYLTDVDAYERSESYYKTRDQNGNVWEWNEAAITAGDGTTVLRGLRGGGYGTCSDSLMASYRWQCNPATENNLLPLGFRVANAIVPSPGSVVGLTSLGLTWLLLRRRRRAIR